MERLITFWLFSLIIVSVIIVYIMPFRFRHCVGDTKVQFSIQSTCKPINYALAVSEMGGNEVHRYVGHEPSGESYNHIKLGHGSEYITSSSDLC